MTTTRGTTNRNARGSARNRRARKQWLLDAFGDGAHAPCAYCGVLLTVATVTADRWPVPGCRGGRYVRGNVRPACGRCNSEHGGALRRCDQPTTEGRPP